MTTIRETTERPSTDGGPGTTPGHDGPTASKIGGRFGRIRRAALLGLVVALAGLGLAACQPREPVTGTYSVNVNGSKGALAVRQSGSGPSAVFTVTVTAPFRPIGFTCPLTTGTVVARLTATGPTFSETFSRFNATTCAKIGDGYTTGSVATFNDDKSLTLGLPTSNAAAQSALLVRAGDGANLAELAAAGTYSIDVNGSQGELTVHQSGSGGSAIHTVTVTAPFRPSGFTCPLTTGTVVARLTGTGPTFSQTFSRFNATTCAKIGDGYTTGSIALLNIDNTITLGLPSSNAAAHAALLVRTGDGTTVTSPTPAGTYGVDVNGSQGTLTVHTSGSGASAVHTVTVSSAFAPSGFGCSLTPGTVVASFTGEGPTFSETFSRFNATTCAKIGDGYTTGSIALLNIDNTITLGLPAPTPPPTPPSSSGSERPMTALTHLHQHRQGARLTLRGRGGRPRPAAAAVTGRRGQRPSGRGRVQDAGGWLASSVATAAPTGEGPMVRGQHETTRQGRSRRWATTAAILVVGMLAACSSGSNDADQSTGAAEATEASDTTTGDDTAATDEAGWIVASSPEEYGVGELTISTSTDGTEWSEVGSAPNLIALDDGPDGWVGVDHEGTVYASDDLAQWDEVASMGEGLTVLDLAYGDGRFVAVGATIPAGTVEGTATVIASSTDGITWQTHDVPDLDLGAPTPASDHSIIVERVTFADGDGFIAHAAAAVASDREAITLVSSDGESWEVAGDALPIGASDSAAGAGTIVTGFVTGELSADQRLRLGALATRTAPDDPLALVADHPFEEKPLSHLAYGDDRFLALSAESFNEGTGSGAHDVHVSDDGRTWEQVGTFDGYVAALAFGAVPSTEPADPADTADIRGIEWTGRSYELCDETATLDGDGRWTSPDDAVAITLEEVLHGDADGDGDEDAVLVFSCAPIGGNAYPNVVNLVFTIEAGDTEPTQLGEGFSGDDATIVDGGIRTIDPVWADGDPRSSPSGTRTTMWHHEDGAWVPTVVEDTTTSAPAPTTAPARPTDPGATGDLPRVDGYGPVGSGCSPGPGSLPDGWWFGFSASTPAPGATFGFDLACYGYEEMADEVHGHDDVVVTNTNTALRDVRVAADAAFTCSTVVDDVEQPCGGYTDPAVWVRIEGGVATKVVTQLWWE